MFSFDHDVCIHAIGYSRVVIHTSYIYSYACKILALHFLIVLSVNKITTNKSVLIFCEGGHIIIQNISQFVCVSHAWYI